MESDPIELIAQAAHTLWREQLQRDGWRSGPRYDCSAKQHDGLVPYDRLSPADRYQLRLTIESEGIPERLVRLVDLPRGPSRPFILEEMNRGRKVQLVDQPQETGEIESWSTDAGGYLESIRVRWPDGSEVSYAAQEGALVRPEEL